MGWIISPKTKNKWSNAQRVSGFPSYIYEGGFVNGYPAQTTSNLASTDQCIFARFSDAVLGIWAVDIVSNPYSLATFWGFGSDNKRAM